MLILIGGGNKGWVEYVLNGTTTKPRNNDKVEIIDGDFDFVKSIYESTNYSKDQYTKIVLSFADNNISDDKMKEIYEEFKTLFMNGLEEDEYTIGSVIHKDSDHKHIHICIPKLNLLTGTMNDYYFDKRDRPRLELIRDYLNNKYGDTTPKLEEIQKTEIINETKLEIINEWRTQYNQDTLEKKEAIKASETLNDLILSAIQTENIKSFQELKSFITTNFGLEIVKEGWEGRYIDKEKDEREIDYFTLSVKKPNGKTILKLKGDIYGEHRGIWGHNSKSPRREETIGTTTNGIDRTPTIIDNTNQKPNRQIKFRNQRTLKDITTRLMEANERRCQWIDKRYSKDRKNTIRNNRKGNITSTSEQVEIRKQNMDNNNHINITNNDTITNIQLLSVDTSISKLDNNQRQRQSTIHSNQSTTNHSKQQQTILSNNEIGGNNENIKFDRTENERIENNQQSGKRTIIEDGSRIIQSTRTNFEGLSKRIGNNIQVVAGRIETMKKEIDLFKEDISLVDFVESLGGEINKNKSTKNSILMDFHNTKLVIQKNKNGHYTYFDLFDQKNNGTIIDFYQKVVDKNSNFGKTMTNLRKFFKQGYIPTNKLEINSGDEAFDYSRITKNIDTNDIENIENYRDISKDTIKEFESVILKDNRHNFCFPHMDYFYDENDKFKFHLSGFEIKNVSTEFKSQSGTKGLWGKRIGQSQDIYIFESAFDGMAFRELHKKEGFYISMGGSVSPKQIEILKTVIKNSKSQNINFCLDNDEGGNNISKQIADIIRPMEKTMTRITSKSKDWNQDLKNQKNLIRQQQEMEKQNQQKRRMKIGGRYVSINDDMGM